MFGKGKEYLSYSAIRLWQQSPERYRRKYYDGEQEVPTVYTTFGKRIAELLEARDFTGYPALEKVPPYLVSEESVEVDIGGVPIKGFIDLYEPDTFSFGEVKTGIVHATNGPPWTAVKVRQHDQLPFYSLILKEKFGKVDPTCHLIWLETSFKKSMDQVGSRLLEGVSRELELTGAMKVFKRRIAEWERKRIRDMIISTAIEIQDDFKRNK